MRMLCLLFVSVFLSIGVNAANLKQLAKSSKSPLHITSDKLVVFDKKGFYEFSGNVIAKRGNVTLKANKMNVFKNMKTGDIYKIVCIGNVIITQQNKKAEANKAIYENKEQKITLIGQAKVTSDKNIISADMIVYYINKDYAIAQSINAKKRVKVTIYPNKKENIGK